MEEKRQSVPEDSTRMVETEKVGDAGIILIPQPSSDANDPLVSILLVLSVITAAELTDFSLPLELASLQEDHYSHDPLLGHVRGIRCSLLRSAQPGTTSRAVPQDYRPDHLLQQRCFGWPGHWRILLVASFEQVRPQLGYLLVPVWPPRESDLGSIDDRPRSVCP